MVDFDDAYMLLCDLCLHSILFIFSLPDQVRFFKALGYTYIYMYPPGATRVPVPILIKGQAFQPIKPSLSSKLYILILSYFPQN